MKNLFTPGATLCRKQPPEVLSCTIQRPMFSSQVSKATTLISTRQMTKVVFGNMGNVYSNQTKIKFGGKSEGQLGGSLGKPKNF